MLQQINFVKIFFFSFFIVFLFSVGSASENDQERISDDIMKIAVELKCLECEGQNVYESNSNFSQSIKAYIREELKKGKNTKDIIHDLHKKYGDEILMTPPVQANTYALWILPFFLLSFGFILLLFKLKR
tara:strand:- start:408 stop:797 length:390 start_codon:yes stop_codon:yes gene_type:complete